MECQTQLSSMRTKSPSEQGNASLRNDPEMISAVLVCLVRSGISTAPVSYTHLRAHETVLDLVCRLLLEKKKFSEKLCFDVILTS